MEFGTTTWEKRDLALAAATAFGVLTTRLGSRFGAHGALRRRSTAGPRAAPLGGRDALRRSLRTLATTPRHRRRRATAGAPSVRSRALGEALGRLGRRGLRRGLVVVVSDSSATRSLVSARCVRCPRRHQVLVVEIRDPRELTLPVDRAC